MITKTPAIYHQTNLPQGPRLVTEEIASATSIALGLWVAVGSRHEEVTSDENESGLAHLIEHMIFKGTASRDKLAIAREIDLQGGQANAFTTKEFTCFHTRVRAEHWSRALDLLVDIFQDSQYDEQELELEKKVICQEIAMVEDEPEELVHELSIAAAWPDHPLGRPVAGTLASVNGLTKKAIHHWLEKHYVGPKLVISAAGAVNHDQLAHRLEEILKVRPQTQPTSMVTAIPQGLAKPIAKHRRLEQTHLVLASDFPSVQDERRHPASVLNLALGGNMSSRLFQEIREKRGLAYSVFSNYTPYQGAGRLEIYAAAAPDQVGAVEDLIWAELEKLQKEPLSRGELAEAVEGLKTGLILNEESWENRMARLAKNEFIFNRPIDLAEINRDLDRISPEDIQALAREYWPRDRVGRCLLGPVKKMKCRVSS